MTKGEHKKTAAGDEATFETSLKSLETVVARLEKGELSLEESIRLFEEGVNLGRLCEQQLKAAEEKIRTLKELLKPGESGV